MKYQDLHEDGDGESHWKQVNVELQERSFAPPANAIEISEPISASAMLFLRLSAGWNEPVHPSPIRQTLICTQGVARVTASDGETREIGRGDVWLMRDKNGRGHHTHVISDVDFECVIVQHEAS